MKTNNTYMVSFDAIAIFIISNTIFQIFMEFVSFFFFFNYGVGGGSNLFSFASVPRYHFKYIGQAGEVSAERS